MPRTSYLTASTVRAPERRRAALRNAIACGARVELRSPDGETVEVPELTELLESMLAGLSDGRELVMLLSDEEVTPAEAGRLLGLSRQYVDRLIDLGDIPARRLPGGRHRRLRVADVLAYKAARVEGHRRISDGINALTDAGVEY